MLDYKVKVHSNRILSFSIFAYTLMLKLDLKSQKPNKTPILYYQKTKMTCKKKKWLRFLQSSFTQCIMTEHNNLISFYVKKSLQQLHYATHKSVGVIAIN